MRVWVTCALLAILSATPAFAQTTADRAIDPTKSRVQFSIEHIFVQRVNGTIPILSGTVRIQKDATTPSSVTATLDATKVGTDEPDQTACIQSPNYFDVKKFPTWTFTSTKITSTGPSTFTIDGTLTIHGTPQPEQLTVTASGDAAHPSYHATGEINRYAFNMHGTRLDPVIGSTADITLDIDLR
jgi:polyisoprenoid-binding protein YceI